MRLVTVKSRFFSVMLIISIALSAISVICYETNSLRLIYQAAGAVTVPVQKLSSAISGAFSDISLYFSDIERLTDENNRLKDENARLTTENKKILALEKENERLKQYLDLKEERQELEFVDARIVSRDIGFIQTFSLDKGTFHGVEKNMPVITESGLLGIIIEAGYSTSRGITIINHNTSVGVYMERAMTSAILKGSFELYEKGLCKVVNLPTDTDVTVGDLVYTSGYGSIYPRDIVVGTVVSIEPNPENYTLSAIVEPSADMTLSDNVMIVTSSEILYE